MVIIFVLCACSPAVGDLVTAKDSAWLYTELGQFTSEDPRGEPCLVDHNQTLTVIGSGYNKVWEFEYVVVGPVQCDDGRSLAQAYGATSQFSTASR